VSNILNVGDRIKFLRSNSWGALVKPGDCATVTSIYGNGTEFCFKLDSQSRNADWWGIINDIVSEFIIMPRGIQETKQISEYATITSLVKQKCNCTWDGPNGVYAKGCSCGGI
jgi:hypothetical protein